MLIHKIKQDLEYVDRFYRLLKVQYEGFGAVYWTQTQLKQLLNLLKKLETLLLLTLVLIFYR